MVKQYLIWPVQLLDRLRAVEFLAPLALRIYLAPVFWTAGVHKLVWDGSAQDFALSKLRPSEGIIEWFGNADWGLGLPLPELMAWLATYTEFLGAILLALGLAVRFVSLPLMGTMLVATFTVHWKHGWQAVHDPMSPWASEMVGEAAVRLARAREILQEYGDYDWLTEYGSFVISNNGIEWAVTYFVMLFALFCLGPGRWVSCDFWLRRRYIGDV